MDKYGGVANDGGKTVEFADEDMEEEFYDMYGDLDEQETYPEYGDVAERRNAYRCRGGVLRRLQKDTH
jgi:hypothetical protein